MDNVNCIITKSQRDYGERILRNLSKREIALGICLSTSSDLLSGKSSFDDEQEGQNLSAVTEHFIPAAAANIDEEPTQAALFENHESLIESFDSYALSMCYLIKIRNFVPYLIKDHGAEYNYNAQIRSKVKSAYINIVSFNGDGLKALNELRRNAETIYVQLEKLREKMNEDTLSKTLEFSVTREFTEKFCQGRPPMFQDWLGRMEYLFFTEHNIPLGLFRDASHNIQKWIQRKNYEAVCQNNPIRLAKSFRHLDKFPGVTCIPNKDVAVVSSRGKFTLANALIGTLPKNGVMVDLHETASQKQNRLVR